MRNATHWAGYIGFLRRRRKVDGFRIATLIVVNWQRRFSKSFGFTEKERKKEKKEKKERK